jgi:hypothetical protein
MLNRLSIRTAPVLRPAQASFAQQLLDQARRALHSRVCDPRTEEVYSAWIRRYLEFAAPDAASDLDNLASGAFLARLALAENVSPTALKRARRALAFLEIVVLQRFSELPATTTPVS